MTGHERIIVSAPGPAKRRWRVADGVTGWAEFAAWLRDDPTGGAGGKTARPYCPVTLKEAPGHRRNENLEVRHALTLDADAAGADYLDRLTETLRFQALSHTTASHTDQRPRWRTVVPLARPVTPEEAQTLSAWLLDVLGRGRFDVQASTSPVAVAYAPAWPDVQWHEHHGPVLDPDAWLLLAPPLPWSPHAPVGEATVAEWLDENSVADLEDLPTCTYGRAALTRVRDELEATVEGQGVHRAMYRVARRAVELITAGCWSIQDLAELEKVAKTLRAVERPREWDEALASALGKGRFPDSGCSEHTGDVFNATQELQHIRQAAHSRSVPATLVLLSCLNQVMLRVPPTVTLPPVVASRASLNLGTVAVGSSGASKSSSVAVAAEVLGSELPEGWVLPLGSGEGMIDAFYARVEVGPRGKTELQLVDKDDRHRLFQVDEGETLRKLTERSGTTLGPFLRTALHGEMLGTTNSKAGGHSRRVPGQTYRLGLHINLHPSQADILLGGEKDDTGTPQRFLWGDASGDELPDSVDDLPPWPGSLRWEMPPGLADGDVRYPEAIQREVRQAKLDSAKGRVAPRAAHANLTRLKVAFALALLHGEAAITGRWWALAGVLVARSLALQDRCMASLSETIQAKQNAAEIRRSRAVEAAGADRLQRAVVQIVDKVRAAEGRTVTWRDVKPSRTLREEFATAELVAEVEKQAGVAVEADTGRNGGVAFRFTWTG